MAETEENGKKLSISYPLLTLVLTVLLYLTGHLGLSVWWASQMQTRADYTNQRLIEITAQQGEDRKAMQAQIDLLKVYIDALREKEVKMESQIERRR